MKYATGLPVVALFARADAAEAKFRCGWRALQTASGKTDRRHAADVAERYTKALGRSAAMDYAKTIISDHLALDGVGDCGENEERDGDAVRAILTELAAGASRLLGGSHVGTFESARLAELGRIALDMLPFVEMGR